MPIGFATTDSGAAFKSASKSISKTPTVLGKSACLVIAGAISPTNPTTLFPTSSSADLPG